MVHKQEGVTHSRSEGRHGCVRRWGGTHGAHQPQNLDLWALNLHSVGTALEPQDHCRTTPQALAEPHTGQEHHPKRAERRRSSPLCGEAVVGR